ncbi:DUF4142 domain-containing protein [Rubrolithibacter danxiaensis]|uniref:DUF4142 domain-containing protein n=1 Tax=Rubrolithibacter danxiaensis TaxID=3390805 RepID=UPI003BF799BF
MKKNGLILLASMALAIAACSSNGSKGGDSDTSASTVTDSMTSYDSATTVTDATDTSSNDATEFALKAGDGGIMEVQLGEIAQKNAQNQRVKNFGAMMVRDHSKANKELMMIASKKNITIPSALSPEHQEHVDKLKKLMGADFDKEYMSMMTDDHKKDIDEFEDASKNLKDDELKSFASKTLPVLKMHLDSAQAVKDAVK